MPIKVANHLPNLLQIHPNHLLLGLLKQLGSQTLALPITSSHLLSVNRFCRDNNCAFYFDADLFRIQDRPTGKPLYIGLSKDGLYPIHGLSLPLRPSLSRCNLAIPNLSPSSQCYPSSVCHNATTTSSIDLWHTRLGHPHQRVLQHVVHDFLSARDLNKVSICKHCVQGKMTQLPIPIFVSTTSSPLELVHSDVWGPSQITSINGTRYFVIFVDDFTRFTLFFPLTHKSQVLSSFIHFKKYHGKLS